MRDEIVLDDYEQEIEMALDGVDLQERSGMEEFKKELEIAAKRHKKLQQSRRVSIRINQEDLIKVKARAKQSGMPYQTLLNSLIHQYADGRVKLRM